MLSNNIYYQALMKLEAIYPRQYAMSGLCSIRQHNDEYLIEVPKLEITSKTDDGNANTRDRYIGILLSEYAAKIEKTENYRILFNKIYESFGPYHAEAFIREDVIGAIYVHNSRNIASKPYCFAYDFDRLVAEGAFFTDISDRPAKHLDSFIQHVIEFVAVACRETTGAVGLPALFPYMWYYWNNDAKTGYTKDPDRYLEQQIQMLVYKLNGSEMRTNESAFTNVSCMDESYIEEFFGGRLFPDGEPVILHVKEIVELEFRFLEVVNDILANKLMTFPVITDCILFDEKTQKFVNEETARKFSDLNTKWSNANMYCGTDISSLSSCCRVLNDVTVMNKKLSGFSNFIGGSDLNIGSVGVITINLPYWAMEMKRMDYGDEKWVYLMSLIERICDYLDCVRGCIKDLIDKDALKVYHRKLIDINRQFNTIGFIGLYDAAKILGVADILNFEKTILEVISRITSEYCESRDYTINVEQVPGETACVKLAAKDKLTFGNTADIPDCYSNQWVPLSEYMSINERSEYAAVLDKLCGGGSILHLNIDRPFTNTDQAWKLLNDIAKKRVIYFAFNTKISVDENEHGFYGDICWCGSPKCGEATRPVGFITLVKNWIPSRKKEFNERKWITI